MSNRKTKNRSFFGQVKDVMSETKWPDGKDMRKYSSTVFVTVLLSAIYFFGVDTLIMWLLSMFLK